jgi:hypothetical protein
MRKNSFLSILVVGLIVVLAIHFFFPMREAFEVTLYGAKKNKPAGSKCDFDPECASDICRHFDTPEGKQFTCM